MGPGEIARARIRAKANGGDIPDPGDIFYINFDFKSKDDVYGMVLSWVEAPPKIDDYIPGPSPKMRVKAWNMKTCQIEYLHLSNIQIGGLLQDAKGWSIGTLRTLADIK